MFITRRSLTTISLIVSVAILATIGQLAFVRFTVQSFYGNELTVCVAIGHWLLWTGIGSLLGSIWLQSRRKLVRLFGLTIFYTFALIMGAYLLLLIRRIFGVDLSEMVGLLQIFTWTGLIFIIPSILNGLFFPFLVAWVEQQKTEFPIHHVYIAEMVGSAIGGLTFIGLILLGLNTLDVLHLAAGAFLIISILIFVRRISFKIAAIGVIVIAELALLGLVIPHFLDFKWKPYQVLQYEESPHQAITLTCYGGNKILFGNNEPIYPAGITESAEELVHFGMLNHAGAHEVLIIGIANPDIYRQLAKYPELEYVETIQPDGKLQNFLDSDNSLIEYHFMIKNVIEDPLKYLKQTRHCFDVVIMNIPTPVNAMWNRYYTLEFLHILKQSLNDHAVVSMQFQGSETYLSEEHVAFLKIMENTARKVFRNVCWIPGETVHLLASDFELSNNLNFFREQLNLFQIENLYVRESYLWDRLSPLKINFLKENLLQNPETEINTLRRPVGYYYDTVLWAQQAEGLLKIVYQRLWNIGAVWFSAFILGILIIIIIWFRIRQHQIARLRLNMAIIGFSVMSLETIVIIIYQSYIGALYLYIALLTMSFMLGGAAGAWLQRRWLAPGREIQFAAIVSGMVIVISILVLLLLTNSALLTVPVLYFGLLCAVGLLQGLIFPLLSYLVKKFSQVESASAAGSIYAWDIVGSCLGVYLTSGILIPVFGLLAAVSIVILTLMTILVGALFWLRD